MRRRALEVAHENGITGEVIVSDNDSDDDSARLAAEAGAIVVHEPERGYGSAYMAGFAVARGRYIMMADADLTYDFGEIPRFLAELDDGADMVVGNRMKNIHPGAMSCSSLDRQPAPLGFPQPSLKTPSATLIAACARCGEASPRWTCERPGWSSPPRW